MSSLLDRIRAFFLEPRDERDIASPTEPAAVARQVAPGADGRVAAPAADRRSSPLRIPASSATRSAPGGATPPAPADGAGSTTRALDRSAVQGIAPRPAAGGLRGFAPPAGGIRGFAPPAVGLRRFAPPAAGDRVPVRGGAASGDRPPLGHAAPPGAGPPGPIRLAAPAAGDAGVDRTDAVVPAGVFAAVLGAPADAVPVAAACAGELRAQARATAAVLCVWGGGEPPAGATTPAVRRLAARLTAHGVAATASGRLAWIALDAAPADAATQVLRARALVDSPIVLAVAGPRPAALEPLLANADRALVVLPPDVDDALRALALASLPARASLTVPPLPPGPPRWAAMAGLARMRSLKPVPR